MAQQQRNNSVTDESYWDGVWSPAQSSLSLLSHSDFYYGKDGLFAKLIHGRLGSIKGTSVLELGGGGENKRLLAMNKWMGADVTALDFSDEGLKIVKELFEVNQCSGNFIHGDICNWVSDQQYDAVVHWGVLEHFIDPKPILEKSFSALKHNGTLLFSMPNMEAVGAHLWKSWCPDNWSKHVLHSKELIEQTLGDIGFSKIESFHYGVPFLKGAEWEIASVAQRPIDLLQKICSVSARLIPFFHKYGNKHISMERGFIAVK